MTAPALADLDPLTAVVVDALERATAILVERAGPRAYSIGEVADRLGGVSPQTVYRLIDGGHLRTVPHLRPLRVAAAELTAYIEGQ